MVQSTSNTSHRRKTKGRGFSLTELMIALGILAIGLVMVGALFPAAMEANRRSMQNVLGSIICENGMATVKARWAALGTEAFELSNMAGLSGFRDLNGRGQDPKMLEVLADDDPETTTAFLLPADRAYYGDPDKYGFVVMMRPIDEDRDAQTFEGFQFVVTSFRRQDPNGLVVCRSLGPNISQEQVFNGGGNLRMGSPLIDRETGIYGTLEKATTDGGTGEMDRGFDDDAVVTSAYVIVELNPNEFVDGTSDMEHQLVSPAMATMVTRTGLTGGDWKDPRRGIE